MNAVLTVQDVAEMLKVCPRTVLNMVKRGEIPATRIGHLWRFEEDSIHNWLREKGNSHTAITVKKHTGQLPKSLITCISPQQVRVEKTAATRREVLEDLAALAARTGKISDYNSFLHSLIEREEIFSTAMDGGIAFPHPRRPIPELDESILAILIVESGVNFDAPSGDRTYLFVLFCAPDDATHVRILARLARTFHNQRKLIPKVRHMSEPARILKELILAEQNSLLAIKHPDKKEIKNV